MNLSCQFCGPLESIPESAENPVDVTVGHLALIEHRKTESHKAMVKLARELDRDRDRG